MTDSTPVLVPYSPVTTEDSPAFTDAAEISDRFFALLVDNLLILAVMLPIAVWLRASMGAGRGAMVTLALSFVIVCIYEGFFLSSQHQATLGKMLFLIRVTDSRGNRLSFFQAVFRCVSRWLLAKLTLGGTYLLALFTKRRRTLHDLVAGTLVLRG